MDVIKVCFSHFEFNYILFCSITPLLLVPLLGHKIDEGDISAFRTKKHKQTKSCLVQLCLIILIPARISVIYGMGMHDTTNLPMD